jgi:hypothetical protein
MESFLASVKKVYIKYDDKWPKYPMSGSVIDDYTKFYNDNKNFVENDTRFLGAIEFVRNTPKKLENYAFPFDKNNITFPIEGETVLIIQNENEFFWLPYTITQYPNYREDYKTSEKSKERNVENSTNTTKSQNYNEVKNTGTPNTEKPKQISQKIDYKVNEKIKFLRPRKGDTIITGRSGNTIRFSEFFLTEDESVDETGNPTGGTPSPSIFIRNKQNPSLDSEKIGTLVDESIDLDGTSVYITSGKVKIPFKETIKKQKVAFTEYPNSKDLKGNQLFINSDRILLSAKASEFIIFGKGNTGVITDGRYTIDSAKEIYAHSNKDIILHTNKNIVLNSDASGVVYVGKVGKPGGAGADVQRMVLAGELIQIMNELIDEMCAMVFATPVGPTSAGSHNVMVFKMIKAKLSKIQSSRNFLSK